MQENPACVIPVSYTHLDSLYRIAAIECRAVRLKCECTHDRKDVYKRQVYTGLRGRLFMSACLAVYALAVWLGQRLIQIEV